MRIIGVLVMATGLLGILTGGGKAQDVSVPLPQQAPMIPFPVTPEFTRTPAMDAYDKSPIAAKRAVVDMAIKQATQDFVAGKMSKKDYDDRIQEYIRATDDLDPPPPPRGTSRK